MPEEPIAQSVSSAWSEPAGDLSGKLRVEFEDLAPGLRHVVYVELKNHSPEPVSLISKPEIRAQLHDGAATPVSTSDILVTGPVPAAQWAVVPRDAYIGLRVDLQTVGVPTREHGTALLAVGGGIWALRAGQYVLDTALVFSRLEDGPANQWVGELELPPVEVVVTEKMLAPN